MHYRCVLYLLQCYVLVGLDWAEPMMSLLLHIKCSCIFMHTYLQFFYILMYWLCWCFSTCLSFSLSFFLVSCVMAPKQKFVPSQNPLCSGTSTSSSDPTPFSVRFRDEKARKDFSENFSKWGVHSECQVILSDFSNSDLPTVIYNRGWESLCDIPVTCPSVLIQEFYTNMHGFDYSVSLFVTCVRGMRIMVTLDIVFEVLHVQRVTHPNFPGCERLRIVSKDELISSFL